MAIPLVLLVAGTGLIPVSSSTPSNSHSRSCRCVPPAPCWASVPWDVLNVSVSGRLIASVDEMMACMGKGIDSEQCSVALAGADDEFWLADQPNGYQHTGLYGTWNISTSLSAFSVLAETESDVRATVGFAARHSLRLVVKNTGHDWLGRSTAAGSLLLWTHKLNQIEFHDAFTPAGAVTGTAGLAAVTVGAGVQFQALYPAANNRRFPGDPYDRQSIVMGGTCDSVGVAGCWLGGCYGPFTKLYGNGAVNLLEARVVVANGSVVVASASAHPDLFYTLRGGGGGNTGVVTQFTARVHPAPRWVGTWSFAATASTAVQFRSLVRTVLSALANAMEAGQTCASGGMEFAGGPGPAGYNLNFTCSGFEANVTTQAGLFGGWLDPGCTGVPGVQCNSTGWTWRQSDYNRSAPAFPWMERHPDREIGTELVGSLTKWFPIRGIRNTATTGPTSLDGMAAGIVRMTDTIATMECEFTNYVMFAKQQAYMGDELEAEFNRTAQNPVVLGTVGLWAPYGNIPSLPQLPPTPTMLKALWPRLQKYAVRSPADPLWAPCAAGAAGDAAQAAACFRGWETIRVPALQVAVDRLRDMAWTSFPNRGDDGLPYSGSYWNEADYWDRDFANSHWGKDVYAKLLRLKDRYDPAGLFYGHHSVGSERWSADGNCPK